jgi:hypothetical protein
MQTTVTTPIAALSRLVGRETALEWIHGDVRNAVQAVPSVVEHGMCLVTCSDEYQGELRASFDRDVAQPIMASRTLQQRRIFSVANMGGRVEPGALKLASDHFTVKSAKAGAKLLLVEIAAHVGKIVDEHEVRFGILDRFGLASPCCGALTLLLAKPSAADAVRHPWFDQLNAFFGPVRLEALRRDASPMQMVKTAIVHAVLQVESAITDLLREPPITPTHIVIVPLVVINQRGPDSAFIAGWHHLYVENGDLSVRGGTSLRSTPAALEVALESARLRVENGADYAADEARRRASKPSIEHVQLLRELAARSSDVAHALSNDETRAEIARTANRWRTCRASGELPAVYARPILRGLLHRCARRDPALGLAVLAVSGAHTPRGRELAAFLERSHAADARRVSFHDHEAELQELEAVEAGRLLDALVAAG